jgi:hypothetical protein
MNLAGHTFRPQVADAHGLPLWRVDAERPPSPSDAPPIPTMNFRLSMWSSICPLPNGIVGPLA